MKLKNNVLLASLTLALSLGLSAGAEAATVFTANLAVDGCPTGCGGASYGTVTVTDNGAGDLHFDVKLTNAAFFQDTSSQPQRAFEFNLSTPSIFITGLPSTFVTNGSQIAGSHTDSPFGTFRYDVAFPRGTTEPNNINDLSFDVMSLSPLSLSDLGFNTVNGQNVYFAADITTGQGLTGSVGALAAAAPSPVPEPGAWALLLTGVGLAGAGMRRRSQAIVALA